MDKALRTALLFVAFCVPLHAQILSAVMQPQPSSAPATDLTVEASATGSAGSCGSPSLTLSGGNAGDLIVCAVEGTPSSSVSDGTSSFTGLTQAGSGGFTGRLYYLLSSNGAGKTYTANTGCAGASQFQCIDVNAAAGKTWHFEAANQAAATSASVDSGSVTTTHGDGFVYFAPWINYPGGTCISSSSLSVASLTVSQPSWSPLNFSASAGCTAPPTAFQYAAYLILGSGISGDGTLTIGSSEQWIAMIGAWYAQ